MTVLEKNAAASVDTERTEVTAGPAVTRRSAFRAYLLAGLVAAMIGVGALVGANGLGLMGTDNLSPVSIAEIRAQQLAENLESRYWAQLARIDDQRAQGMVDFYAGQHQAQLAKVYEQRAEDIVQLHALEHQARMDRINEQRGQDMVTFKRGWEGVADS
jgi:hypothetical protein